MNSLFQNNLVRLVAAAAAVVSFRAGAAPLESTVIIKSQFRLGSAEQLVKPLAAGPTKRLNRIRFKLTMVGKTNSLAPTQVCLAAKSSGIVCSQKIKLLSAGHYLVGPVTRKMYQKISAPGRLIQGHVVSRTSPLPGGARQADRAKSPPKKTRPFRRYYLGINFANSVSAPITTSKLRRRGPDTDTPASLFESSSNYSVGAIGTTVTAGRIGPLGRGYELSLSGMKSASTENWSTYDDRPNQDFSGLSSLHELARVDASYFWAATSLSRLYSFLLAPRFRLNLKTGASIMYLSSQTEIFYVDTTEQGSTKKLASFEQVHLVTSGRAEASVDYRLSPGLWLTAGGVGTLKLLSHKLSESSQIDDDHADLIGGEAAYHNDFYGAQRLRINPSSATFILGLKTMF